MYDVRCDVRCIQRKEKEKQFSSYRAAYFNKKSRLVFALVKAKSLPERRWEDSCCFNTQESQLSITKVTDDGYQNCILY